LAGAAGVHGRGFQATTEAWLGGGVSDKVALTASSAEFGHACAAAAVSAISTAARTVYRIFMLPPCT
ncbi:MAG TPA: hypothetical protein VNM39_01490, partial [Verrucomicrobiae bacterium]|nr:hypothetical protein [Verrucomicrobiae bacterium]